MTKLYDTGAVVESTDEWVVLNPAAPFKLHVTGITIDVAVKLKRALDKGRANYEDAGLAVMNLVFKAKEFRCREIESFVERCGPVLHAAIQAKIAAMPDWQRLVEKGDAAASKRQRLFWEFTKAAVAECGDPFRFLPSLVADDVDEKCRGVVDLLCYTYVAAWRASRDAEQRAELLPRIRAWQFMAMSRGCCLECDQIAESHPPDQCPVIPQHAGCGCWEHPVFK